MIVYTIAELQEMIIAERVRQKWRSATDIERTVSGLAEELGEFSRAVRHSDRDGMVDGLLDLAVFCLGGLKILGIDNAHEELERVVEANAKRPLRPGH